MKVWDSAWLDSQYNNRARVPEHPEILAGWAEASALARSRMRCQLDLRYGSTDAETLDVFLAAEPGSPVLVFIHGGWWRGLDKRDHSFVAPAFVQAGATVVVPNYALCPAVGIDTIALQMVGALIWTWRNAARFGGDRRRIVVAGHSAGGHLATLLLCCDWRSQGTELPARVVQSAVSVSGLYDLEPIRHVPFLADDLKLTADLVRRLSPVGFPRPAGRLLTAAGAEESEEFLRHNGLMQKAWGSKTVPVVDSVPNTNHFTVLHALVDAGEPLHGHVLSLLGL